MYFGHLLFLGGILVFVFQGLGGYFDHFLGLGFFFLKRFRGYFGLFLGSRVFLGLSMGRFGSGLCPTRNRPDQIGWRNSRPAADHEKPSVVSDRTRLGGGRS